MSTTTSTEDTLKFSPTDGMVPFTALFANWAAFHLQTTVWAPDINQVHAALSLTGQCKEDLVLDWLRPDCKRERRAAGAYRRLCVECVCVRDSWRAGNSISKVVSDYFGSIALRGNLRRSVGDATTREHNWGTALIARQREVDCNCHCQPSPVKVTFDDPNFQQAHKHYNYSAQSDSDEKQKRQGFCLLE